MKTPDIDCPICGGEISNISRPFHASVKLASGERVSRYGWTGFCQKCEIPLKRTSQKKHYDTGWFSTMVQLDSRIKLIGEKEIEIASAQFLKYSKLLERWNTFLKYKKKSDEIYLYLEEETNKTGFLIVRNKKPLLDFALTKYQSDKIRRNEYFKCE